MRHSNRNPRCRRGTILPAILAIFLWGAIQSAWCAGESPRAEVRPHSGRPTLLIDGRAHSGLSASTYTPIIKDFKELSAIGLDIHCFSTTADYSLYGLAAPCWTGPGQYDYTQLDERARMVLKADPNNMIIPRIYIAAPGWWLDQHPDEVCVFGDGSSKLNYTPGGGAIPPGGELRVPSMASRLWRETTKDNLRRLIDHIEAQDYGKRVIGYHLASGITEEWMYWGYQLNQLGDYSKPAREGFRWWLKNKYKSDAGLRKAWHRPAITLATAAVPSDAARRTSGEGILLNPAKSQDIVDYNFYLSDMVVDTIGEFAHAVKEHTKRTKLIGVFYGYVMELSWDRNAIPPSGHLAIDRMLTSPDIDFFSAPSSYSARQPATGFSAFMSLTDSFRLHGKLLVDENDYRTHLAQDKTAVFGYVNNLEQGLGQQWREFGNVLAHGVGMWWFNMGGGWYSDPKLLAEMKRMREAGVRSVELPFASTAQIAVVVDPATPNWLTHTETYHGLALQRGKAEWARLGAPYAIMSLKDYAQGLGGPYRMAIFANLLRVEPKTTKAIRRRLNKERTLAVWQYAPGYLSDEGYSVKGIERLTGFRIKRLDPSDDRVAERQSFAPGRGRSQRRAARWRRLQDPAAARSIFYG